MRADLNNKSDANKMLKLKALQPPPPPPPFFFEPELELELESEVLIFVVQIVPDRLAILEIGVLPARACKLNINLI